VNTRSQYQYWPLLILTIAVFATFGNTLFNHFVWDDNYLIVSNPYIKNAAFIPQFFEGDLVQTTTSLHYQSGYYRPLSMLSFMADYHVWKLNPFGYHLTNILIHVLNTILIFYLVLLLLKNRALSFMTALLFAVHPIHSEAVGPIFNRMGIQATLFMLVSVICFIKSVGLSKTGYILLSLISFIIGLFSKENVIILPAVILGLDFIVLKRCNFKDLFRTKSVVFYLSLLGLSLLYLWIRGNNVEYELSFPTSKELLGQTLAANLFLHILTAMKIFGLLMVKAFVPFKFSPEYWIEPVKQFLDWQALIGLLGFIGLIGLAIRLRKSQPVQSFFIVFFLLSVIPYTNILLIAEVYTFHERFLYFPSMAACFFMAQLLNTLTIKFKSSESVSAILKYVPATLILIFGIQSATYNYVWRTNLSLWQHVVRLDPNSQMGHMNLGEAYIVAGKFDKAIEEFKKSVRVNRPTALASIYLAKINLANIYLRQEKLDHVLPELEEAVTIGQQINLNIYAAYDKIGVYYAYKNQPQKAEDFFKKSLALNKNFISTLFNLGVLYYLNNQFEKAEHYLSKVHLLDHDFLEASYFLGLTLQKKGELSEAKRMFAETLKVNPNYEPAQRQFKILQEK